MWDEIASFGQRAFLVTVGTDGRPHAVSTVARVDGDAVVLALGSTSRANIASNPSVMLLWPPVDGGPYALLVDGDAAPADGDDVRVTPVSAVLHRVAGADETLASCVRLLQAPA